MSRFGDFTLLEEHGRSATADRYKATHATQGGPFFLKVYRRLDRRLHADWNERGNRLIGRSHPNVAGHLGHGIVGDVPFSVAPWLDGLDLPTLAASLKERRVHLGFEHCFVLLADLAGAVAAAHAWAQTAAGPLLVHGEVTIGHVRLGPDGQVWLTGLATPRGPDPGQLSEPRFDLAGVAAVVYELVPSMRGGAARPPLPTVLDRVIRRALGIGPVHEHLTPSDFIDRLADAADALQVKPDRPGLADLVRRTMRALEKRQHETAPRGAGRPADAIPELLPVGSAVATNVGPNPLSLVELEPLAPTRPAGAAVRVARGTPSAAAAPPGSLAVSPAASPAVSPAASPAGAPRIAGDEDITRGGVVPRPLLAPAPETTKAPPLAWPVAPPASAPPPVTPRPAPSSVPVAQPPTTRSASASPASLMPAPAIPAPAAPVPVLPAPTRPAPASPAPVMPAPSIAAPVMSAPVMSAPVMSAPVMSAPVMPAPVMPAPVMPAPVMPAPATIAPLMPAPVMLTPTASPSRPAPPVMPAPLVLSPAPAVLSPVSSSSLGVLAPLVASSSPPRPRAPLLADADESGGVGRPASPPLVPPPGMEPPSPSPPPSLFERDNTDPDAVRPARLEAQKALPSVQALLRAAVVTMAQVEAAAIEQAQRGGRTLEILVAQGAATDDVIASALARASGRPQVVDGDLAAVVDGALLRRIPQTYALARRLLPLRADGATLVLAVADPFDQKVIDEVRGLLHADVVDVRVAPRAALTRATLAAFGAAGAESPTGPRVLLCMHDDAKAQRVGARLAQEGMQVEHVVEGVTARQILSTRAPHAVLCAHDLPKVDGRALLLHARGIDTLADLPFYVVGPRGDDELVARMLDLGADDFFTEPLRLDVIVAKLRRAAGKRVELAPASSSSSPPPLARVPTDQHARPPTVSLSSVPSADEFAFEDLPDLPPELSGSGQVDDVPAMPTGVMGTLRQMSLPEIVQSLEMGRKTASVDIVPQDGEKGRIAFSLGSIQFAECGALTGDQAFYALMRHREGFFRIHYGDAPPAINIHAPTTFLLLEAMRLMDEGDR